MTEKKNIYIYININIFEIYFFIYFFILFIYLFIYFLLLFSGTQLRICVQVATPLRVCGRSYLVFLSLLSQGFQFLCHLLLGDLFVHHLKHTDMYKLYFDSNLKLALVRKLISSS